MSPNYFLLPYVNIYSNSFPKSFSILIFFFSFNLYFLSLSHLTSIFFLSPPAQTLSHSLPHSLDLLPFPSSTDYPKQLPTAPTRPKKKHVLKPGQTSYLLVRRPGKPSPPTPSSLLDFLF